MPNVFEPSFDEEGDGLVRERIGAKAGAHHLGLSLYELAPGESMVFHYHVQREELLIVLHGRLSLRMESGRRDLTEGDVVSFPRGPLGSHGYENRSAEPARVLVLSEQNGPNVSVYPDAGQVGIFDAPHAADRRFGALFNLDDAVSGYGGGRPEA